MEHSQHAAPHNQTLEEAAAGLFRLGRAFGRLPRSVLLEAGAGRITELSAILVVQAVEAGDAAGGDVTIGDVAARLGVDPSTASRLVAQTVEAGYLRRIVARSDRRATVLKLTAEGKALGEGAARYQRAVFAAATEGWSDAERGEFARLFVRFAEAILTDLKGQER